MAGPNSGLYYAEQAQRDGLSSREQMEIAQWRRDKAAKQEAQAKLERQRSRGQYLVDPSTGNADQINADLTRSQYQDWLTTYKPREDQIRALALDTSIPGQAADRADQMALTAGNVAQGNTERTAARYGLDLTGDRATTLERSRDLGTALSRIGASNTARKQAYGRQLGLQEFMTAVDRSSANEGQSNLAAWGDMESKRKSFNKQVDAQNRAQNTQTAAALGSLALMAAFMI